MGGKCTHVSVGTNYYVMSHLVCAYKILRDPSKRKPNQLENLQLIHDDVWGPELPHRERNPCDAVTLIRVPNQELMVPVLQ